MTTASEFDNKSLDERRSMYLYMIPSRGCLHGSLIMNASLIKQGVSSARPSC